MAKNQDMSPHVRQGSVISSTSQELGQFLTNSVGQIIGNVDSPLSNQHYRQSSTDTCGTPGLTRQTPSLDLGYHTLLGSLSLSPWSDRTQTLEELERESGQCQEFRTKIGTDGKVISSKNTKLKEKKSKSSFEKLPDDLMLRILTLLPQPHLIKASLVNKRFHRLAWHPLLWRRISLDSKQHCDNAISTILGILQRRSSSHFVEAIQVKASMSLTDQTLELIGHHCPDLTSVEFRNCPNLSNEGIQKLATSCSSLSSLNVSGK